MIPGIELPHPDLLLGAWVLFLNTDVKVFVLYESYILGTCNAWDTNL